MKRALITIVLLALTTSLFSQSITIGTDGIVRCKDVPIGTTQTILGDTYEVVDRNLLITRRNEGKNLTKVCVSNVTDMSEMFINSQFNQPIGSWDVSSVADMSYMFSNSQFNQPIGNWDVSSVTDMTGMFSSSQFNQPIGNWVVSNVNDMRIMFSRSSFNQAIEDWNVSNVIDMKFMFRESIFDQPIGTWDVSSVTDMSGMFSGTIFNQPIGDWEVSSVTDMRSMFLRTSDFNHPLDHWNVARVTNMSAMFQDAKAFNQDLNSWDVSSVVTTNHMFSGATLFNGNISDWDVSNVSNFSVMFANSVSFSKDISRWDVSSAENMMSMFFGASSFNHSIGNWDISSVTNMNLMFYNATSFNQTINLWCVPNIISEPTNFSVNSPLLPENKPLWGTCPGEPGQLSLISPISNSSEISITPMFSWDSDSSATRYQLQVFEGLAPTIIDVLVSDTTYLTQSRLKGNLQHNWRVRGINDNRTRQGEPLAGAWSTVWSFTTEKGPLAKITPLSPSNGTLTEPIRPTLKWQNEPNYISYRVQVSIDGFNTFVVNEVVTDTTFTTPQLNYSTQHQWRIRGATADENGEWSEPWSFTTIIQAPDKPVLLSPNDAITNLTVLPKLTWGVSDRAEKYQVQLSLTSNFSSVAADTIGIQGTSFEPDKLQFNTSYYWRVKAINVGGESDWSDTRSFFTEYALDTPILLSPMHESSNITTPTMFSWQPVTGAFNYTLQISDAPSFENLINTASKSLGKSASDEETNWGVFQMVDNLDYGKTYYWRVNAINDDGMSDWSVAFSFTTEPAPISGTVALSSPTNSQVEVKFPVEFKWEQFEAAEFYELQYSTTQSFLANKNITEIEGLTYTASDLSDTTKYYWRVRTYRDEKHSAWSNTWSFTTELRVPEIPVWSPGNNEENISTEPILVWGDSERANTYELQLSETVNFDNLVVDITGLEETRYKVIDLQEGKTYFWRVQARNATGASGWSAPLRFTTEIITSIPFNDLPEVVSLSQNFPNPFNPTTSIRYSLPESADVTLAVYNMMGQLVETLVDGHQSSGWHTSTFNAEQLSSGVYMFRLTSGDMTITRKMTLMK
jgi:surface protein